MHIPNSACSAVIAEVEAALRAAGPPPVSTTSIAHISGCPRCRAGLALLIEAAARNDSGGRISCADCQAQLATFLEIERVASAEAVTRHPALWRHIWSCADCMEDYLLAHSMLAAEAEGSFPPLQLPRRQASPAPGLAPIHVMLTRRALQMALPPRHVGATRGGASNSHMLYSNTLASSRHITIAVREQSSESWSMEVTVDPPLIGVLLLTTGDERFAAPFLPIGSAIISALPARLIVAPDGPALEISIVPAQEQQP
jgi:hypothetical protein